MTPPTGTLVSPTGQIIVSAIPLLVTVHPAVIAQMVGDEAYDATFELTHDGQQAAVAYHQAVQAYGRDHPGAAPVCSCPMCEVDDPEPGVENPANHAADPKGW